MASSPPPAETGRGMRLSGLALTGIVILSLLIGCMAGSLFGGLGGFLTGRTLGQRQGQALPSGAGPAATAAPSRSGGATATPGRSGATGQATPQAQPTRPAGAPTRPAGAATPSSGAAPSGATPRAPQPATAYLGVRYNMLTPDIAAQAGITVTQGAIIGEVVPGSPAEQAGLQPMDVITAVDGKALDDTYALADAISGHKPGDKINLTVFRDGQTVPLTATLGQPPAGGVPAPGGPGAAPATPGAPSTPRPPASGQPSGATPAATSRTPASGQPSGGATPQATPQAAPRTSPSPTPRRSSLVTPAQDGGAYLGVQATAVPADVAQTKKLTPGQGALVASVIPASPAFMAGLFDSDIILAVNKTPVDEVHSLTTLLSPHKPGEKVTLTVIHSDGKKSDVAITLGTRSAQFNQGKPGLP